MVHSIEACVITQTVLMGDKHMRATFQRSIVETEQLYAFLDAVGFKLAPAICQYEL